MFTLDKWCQPWLTSQQIQTKVIGNISWQNVAKLQQMWPWPTVFGSPCSYCHSSKCDLDLQYWDHHARIVTPANVTLTYSIGITMLVLSLQQMWPWPTVFGSPCDLDLQYWDHHAPIVTPANVTLTYSIGITMLVLSLQQMWPWPTVFESPCSYCHSSKCDLDLQYWDHHARIVTPANVTLTYSIWITMLVMSLQQMWPWPTVFGSPCS